jgi:hypothetical protein
MITAYKIDDNYAAVGIEEYPCMDRHIKEGDLKMTKKQILISIWVSQEELDQLDSIWRPNLEYKSRADYVRDRLGMKRLHTKTEE